MTLEYEAFRMRERLQARAAVVVVLGGEQHGIATSCKVNLEEVQFILAEMRLVVAAFEQIESKLLDIPPEVA